MCLLITKESQFLRYYKHKLRENNEMKWILQSNVTTRLQSGSKMKRSTLELAAIWVLIRFSFSDTRAMKFCTLIESCCSFDQFTPDIPTHTH